jgi:hypothetical protein
MLGDLGSSRRSMLAAREKSVSETKKFPLYPALVFALGAAAVIVYALGFRDHFMQTTRDHPFAMGFIKLFCLGTFGELVKCRLAKGSWALDKAIERAVVWGVYGMWFALAFPGFSMLTEGLIRAGLWPGELAAEGEKLSFGANLWLAFSKSIWINVLGMYACGMMVSHEFFNFLIAKRWRTWSLKAFADASQPRFVLAFVPKTLLFWIPAHTFTFAMPKEYQVFIAALLAIALGFMLSVGRKS